MRSGVIRISVRSLAALADDLVAGGMRNEMGETLERHGIAVADGRFDGFGERGNTRHVD